jgi:hypothetical protein
MNHQWNTLTGSYWYVPADYLPATQMSASATAPTPMIDQTVWQITGCSQGYFWGNCAALLYETGTQPSSPPNGFRLIGSVTPDGNVQISFMPLDSPLGAAVSVSGWGRMVQQNDAWAFEMQMSSGVTLLTTHWALMEPTQQGDASWNQLPGTNYSVPAFLEAAGF